MDEKLTLYGYPVEHLAFIAMVMRQNNIMPMQVIEIMTNAGRLVDMLLNEQKRILEQEVQRWMNET